MLQSRFNDLKVEQIKCLGFGYAPFTLSALITVSPQKLLQYNFYKKCRKF